MVQLASPVFVTGGSGFVGGRLLERLRQDGIEVRALARSDASVEAVRGRGAQPVHGDLDDLEAMVESMRGCSVVFHCAAFVGDWGDTEVARHTNVDGTRNVLASARRAEVPHVVHVSTEAVLIGGGKLHDVDESRPLPRRPVGIYPVTKGEAERLALAEDGAGLDVVIVRPRFVWGPGDNTILPEAIAAVERGVFAWIDGGTYRVSMCHVDNCVEGLVLAAAKGKGGEIYFLTDGDPVEFKDFFTRLLATAGVTPPQRNAPRWLLHLVARVGELAWTLLPLPGAPPLTRTKLLLAGEEVTVNDAKARRELGYRNVISTDEGLEALAAFNRARPRP